MTPPHVENADLIAGEADFYCAGCGYNLRGLAGDPKRCPECGQTNPISCPAVTSEVLDKELRKLESGPTFCVAGLLVIAVSVLFTRIAGSGPLCCAADVIGVAVWWMGVIGYADSCGSLPGWQMALVHFHGRVGQIAVAMALIVGASLALDWRVEQAADISRYSPASNVVAAAALIILTALFRRDFRRMYYQALGAFRPLQRDRAADFAREAHRAAIARQRQGPP